MASVYRTDITIKLKNNERYYNLPYATNNVTPTFRWELPYGISQSYFVFEIRTIVPKTLSDGKYLCAYHLSGKIVSSVPEYTLRNDLNPETWAGACEVRLRVFDENNNEYCTHEISTDIYDFEQGLYQGRAWGILNDKYYFVFDSNINTLVNQFNFNYYFYQSTDQNINQNLKYTLQVSDSPLFEYGGKDKIFVEETDISLTGSNANIVGAFQKEIKSIDESYAPVTLSSLLPNRMYFFRVRSYDGYDYSDWSTINAFANIDDSIPKCQIISVDTNYGGKRRPYGEVSVVVRVDDEDSDYVNAHFCYSMPISESEVGWFSFIGIKVEANDSNSVLNYNDEMAKINVNKMIRAKFVESTINIPTNQNINLTWITGEHIQAKIKKNLFLYMVASDKHSVSTPVYFHIETLDNSKIGETNQSVTDVSEKFNIKSKSQLCLHYVKLPETIIRKQHISDDYVVYGDEFEEKEYTPSGADAWIKYWNNEDDDVEINEVLNPPLNVIETTIDEDGNIVTTNKTMGALITNGKFNTVCPDCLFKYEWVKETYNDVIVNDDGTTTSQTKTGWSKVTKSYSDMFLRTIKKDNNTLIFKCPICNKTYDMSLRYDMLNYHIDSKIKKTSFALYHGYCYFNNEKQQNLDKKLELVREQEFNAIKEDAEAKGEEYKEEFEEIEELADVGDGINQEKWGFIGKSPLLDLLPNERPDIEPYFHTEAPKTIHRYHGVYVDGQALHLDVQQDYMHDFEEIKDELSGEIIQKADPDMIALNEQQPWNKIPQIDKYFSEATPDDSLGKDDKETTPQEDVYVEVNDCVSYFYNDYENKEVNITKHNYFWYKAIEFFNPQFTINIKRNENDRYLIQINGEIFSGSILDNEVDFLAIPYIFNNNEENQYFSVYKDCLNKIFIQTTYNKYTDQNEILTALTFDNIVSKDNSYYNCKLKYLSINDRRIKSVKLLYCKNNCYETLGIHYFEFYQKWHDLPMEIGELYPEDLTDKDSNPKKYYHWTYAGEAPKNENSGEDEEPIKESETTNEFLEFSSSQTNNIAAKRITFNNKNGEDYKWVGNKVAFQHNLNCYPFVSVFDSENQIAYFDTYFDNENQISIDFISKSNIDNNWNVVFSYGVPYGKTLYKQSDFQSKIIFFSNKDSNGITWNNNVVNIKHNLDSYVSITLYDNNKLINFIDTKMIDSNTISIDFKNISNVNGNWMIIVNSCYPFNEGNVINHKKIEFTKDDSNITWNENIATFSHNLNTYPIITIYDNNNEIALFPITILNENSILINFGDKSIVEGTWKIFFSKTMNFSESEQVIATSSGEPLFTCYLDEVDENGHHFPYSEEDYKKTGNIFIRTKRYEICNPFEHPIYGYRNWVVIPIPNKKGRFKKKKVVNFRGIAPEKRQIPLAHPTIEGLYIYETGYFNPATNECVSHKVVEDTFTENGEQVYEKEEDLKWQNKLITTVCYVYDYVDYRQGFVKNPTDTFQYHPFNHKAPILINGYIDKAPERKYGLYVLGEYQDVELDENGNQVILDDKGNQFLRYDNGEFVFDDSETYRMYRDSQGEFHFDFNDKKVYDETKRYTNYSRRLPKTEIIPGDNSKRFSFSTEKGESKNLKCIMLDENGKPLLDENGQQKYFSISEYKRYEDTWKNKIPINPEYDGIFAKTVIDTIVPRFKGVFGIYLKHGYEPKKCIEPYWKLNDKDIYSEYIPDNNNYVFDIFKDEYGDLRLSSSITIENYLIDITSKDSIDDNNFYKYGGNVYKKDLNYRIKGRSYLDERNYFSGIPKDEHKAYSIRPDTIYREDRPLRIKGNIQNLETYGNWAFLYLQESWNAYNRLQWSFTQSENEYVVLSAAPIINGVTGKEFNVKTKRAIWDEGLQLWCIPFDKKNLSTDVIDTLNNDNFENGIYYKFSLYAINKNTGIKSSTISSPQFFVSPEAESHATITNMSFDPWTKLLTVKFRFDDVLGREYDIIGFQYSLSDPDVNNNDIDGVWITPTSNLNQSVSLIEGKILNLSSNRKGDNVPSNNYITTHTIYIDLSSISISTPSFRIRLHSQLSANREGLTLPKFQVKLWANEFLKPAEEKIASLEGSISRWVYKESYDEEKEDIVGEWVYVSKEQAVRTLGRIQETQIAMDNIIEKFEEWYCSVAHFIYPDIDAFETYFKTTNNWENWYWDIPFNEFIQDMNLLEEYNSYREQSSISNVLRIKQNFIAIRSFENSLKYFYEERKENYIYNYLKDKKSSDMYQSFLNWYSTKHLLETKEVARRKYMDEKKYWEGDDNEYDKFCEEYSETIIDMTEDEIITFFIKKTKKENEFENYYIESYMYPDTRFEERENIVKQYENEYSSWENSLSETSIPLKSDNISDKYIFFLKYAVENEIIENAYVINNGKNEAQNAFMQQKINGVSYNQQYQGYVVAQEKYMKELQEAKQKKYQIETDHRKYLVSQGFFCNGFVDNNPFNAKKEINMCFRFRVETQPYEGTAKDYINQFTPSEEEAEDEELNKELAIKEEEFYNRWKMYIRTQLDFFDTYNSQNGLKPLRDIIYIGQKRDDNRILASIMTGNSNIRVNQEESSVGGNSSGNQFAAKWSILKKDLPGNISSDYNPFMGEDNNAFNSILLFWRMAPYNLVYRPIFDIPQTLVTKIEKINEFIPESLVTIQDNLYKYSKNTNNEVYNVFEIELENNFSCQEIQELFTDYQNLSYRKNNYHEDYFYEWITTRNYERPVFYIYITNSKLNNPIWKKDVEDIAFKGNLKPYSSDWINRNMIDEGIVQFVTDRPRVYEEIEQVSNENGEETIETQKEIVFADDNLGNFNTNWIPFGVERKKPNVIKYDNQYFLFSHKEVAKRSIKNNITNQYHSFSENRITMSRGFSPNIFGEECVVFPRYTILNPSNIIPNALSFDNPSIIKKDNLWVMYFNVLFFNQDNNSFYTSIFSAESIDLDNWSNFQEVSLIKSEQLLNNIGEPNLLLTSQIVDETIINNETGEEIIQTRLEYTYHLFGVYTFIDNLNSKNIQLVHFISDNGKTFNFNEVVYEDVYSISSPSAIINNEEKLQVYFSLVSNAQNKSIICSITKNNNIWENAIVEKSNIPEILNKTFNGTNWTNEGYYFNPCVIYDYQYGTKVKRLYYNSYNHPYIYDSSNNLIKDEETIEMSIHTEYLEEYEWTKIDLRDYCHRDNYAFNNELEKINIIPISIYSNGNWTPINFDNYNNNFRIPVGKLKLQFISPFSEIKEIKISCEAVNNKITCLSQGAWIDMYNIENTEAIMKPEELDDLNYKVSNYSYNNYMFEKDLWNDYNQWFDNLSEETKNELLLSGNENNLYLMFLIQSQNYESYLKWSRKGPGIFRFLKLVNDYDYDGAYEKET